MVEKTVKDLNDELNKLNMYFQSVDLVPKEEIHEEEYCFRIKSNTIEFTPVIAHNGPYYYIILCIPKKDNPNIIQEYTFTVDPADIITIGNESVLKIQDPSIKFTEAHNEGPTENEDLFNENIGYDCMKKSTFVELISNK